ncbi:acyloxyacyl hydrolase [Flavobacterium johnsoniae]|uniref:acyloxyacyl hydrolase n=1 Tax=Flavobacterium johnsoniae TaxID=986 RepID=UPI0025B06BC2|nr:acyloxyacyl hydrolase [Flavobacterium johnsoniae]WJS96963.1 acyloxyacyl hydrolase [Flavobacterium johnsoniae]
MIKNIFFCTVFFLTTLCINAQNSNFRIGVNYGFGSEFNNKDYTFTNNFYKAQVYYSFKESRNFKYEILIQPEINFGKHQLLNLYFVKPETPNFEEKRIKYMKLKEVREYVMNIGFVVRKPFAKSYSIYLLGSVGPMITDTETERMSSGFAFADVLALGFTADYNQFRFDIRPSLRHVSNAGLGSTNAGYNTKNIEFGVSYQL